MFTVTVEVPTPFTWIALMYGEPCQKRLQKLNKMFEGARHDKYLGTMGQTCQSAFSVNAPISNSG